MLVIKQILEGIIYLEKNNSCHGYINPSSINLYHINNNNTEKTSQTENVNEKNISNNILNSLNNNEVFKYNAKLSLPLINDFLDCPYLNNCDSQKFKGFANNNLPYLSPSNIR